MGALAQTLEANCHLKTSVSPHVSIKDLHLSQSGVTPSPGILESSGKMGHFPAPLRLPVLECWLCLQCNCHANAESCLRSPCSSSSANAHLRPDVISHSQTWPSGQARQDQARCSGTHLESRVSPVPQGLLIWCAGRLNAREDSRQESLCLSACTHHPPQWQSASASQPWPSPLLQ